MKVVVLGGVAAGTKIAAKLMRENRGNEVLVLNKGKNISYAGCGLPYYVGHVIEDREQLIVNTPEKYAKLTGVTVMTETEATKVDPEAKKVTAVNLATGQEQTYDYDKLVISVGASPIKPPIEGCDLENVFFVRTPEDAIRIREAVDAGNVKRAVVVGAGYIGLEIAENLKLQGVRPFVLDMAEHALPGFDAEMAEYVEGKLQESGIPVVTKVAVTGIEGDGKVEKVLTSKKAYKADLVVLSAGIRPNTSFLDGIGLEMFKGTILTNGKGETNLPDIYAAGDCAMVHNALTEKAAWSPMGSTANISGRLIAQNMMGADFGYRGVLGTAVCKLPGLNVGRTGLTEAQAEAEGFHPVSVITVVDDKAHYFPGAGAFVIKMIADKDSLRLLGVQVIGAGAVDKVVDIAVTGIMLKGTLTDLADMDLAYAPPFSTAIHPFEHTLNVLMNKINGKFETFTPAEYAAGAAEGYKVVDACLAPSIEGAPYVELTTVEGPVEGLDPEEKLLLVCNKGKRAYLLQNRLKFYGYKNTKVLEGGITFSDVEA
ncbi:pyridine nucleotide-disulfide oxidoreductase [Petralouisia muris]|uniref:Pyridine nucleotide-disulfide oxidoreductase n=1 Tax=Petralouisia muris TaxID=3032872 RepID=A0AC61S1A8_9FIRM|nr:FAD-dependent oxidoreductase [Petralouisia muris]TGY97688.1 pyridine nucleotide-disulfide oxidoreductase [Petralouisia muris]